MKDAIRGAAGPGESAEGEIRGGGGGVGWGGGCCCRGWVSERRLRLFIALL